MKLLTTPSQTVGPYLHIGMNWLNNTELAAKHIEGEHIVLQGRVVDADGAPVPDGLIEIWQANANGNYAHPDDMRAVKHESGFTGFGRTPTDAKGYFHFSTIKPGSVPRADGKLQAPHIMVNVFARGLLKQLVTRVYFPGDDHQNDPVLQSVPAARRASLIAVPSDDNNNILNWNIVLGGGDHETVFFQL